MLEQYRLRTCSSEATSDNTNASSTRPKKGFEAAVAASANRPPMLIGAVELNRVPFRDDEASNTPSMYKRSRAPSMVITAKCQRSSATSLVPVAVTYAGGVGVP